MTIKCSDLLTPIEENAMLNAMVSLFCRAFLVSANRPVHSSTEDLSVLQRL